MRDHAMGGRIYRVCYELDKNRAENERLKQQVQPYKGRNYQRGRIAGASEDRCVVHRMGGGSGTTYFPMYRRPSGFVNACLGLELVDRLHLYALTFRLTVLLLHFHLDIEGDEATALIEAYAYE